MRPLMLAQQQQQQHLQQVQQLNPAQAAKLVGRLCLPSSLHALCVEQASPVFSPYAFSLFHYGQWLWT